MNPCFLQLIFHSRCRSAAGLSLQCSFYQSDPAPLLPERGHPPHGGGRPADRPRSPLMPALEPSGAEAGPLLFLLSPGRTAHCLTHSSLLRPAWTQFQNVTFMIQTVSLHRGGGGAEGGLIEAALAVVPVGLSGFQLLIVWFKPNILCFLLHVWHDSVTCVSIIFMWSCLQRSCAIGGFWTRSEHKALYCTCVPIEWMGEGILPIISRSAGWS